MIENGAHLTVGDDVLDVPLGRRALRAVKFAKGE